MKKLLLILVLTVSGYGLQAQSGTSTEDNYTKKLKTFFEINGSVEVYKTVISDMIAMFKENYASEAESVSLFENMEKEMLETSLDELVEMLVPVYKEQLTEKDLDALIAFYSTDIGKKYAEKTPIITRESMKVGQLWGMKIAQDVMKKLQD